MDPYLAIASKRDTRRYADRPIEADVAERILDAGRLAGSARNRQPWRFVIVESRSLVERLAETVYEPDNVLGATLVVALVTRAGAGAFDVGRSAQNMMLAAWGDGVASCPNGMPDPSATARVLGLGGEEPVIVLTFGYPAQQPASCPAEEWSARANRKQLAELVRRV